MTSKEKEVGPRKEGHRVRSQGCVAARATCPSVNTHPGARTHTHTHTHTQSPQSLVHAEIHIRAQVGSETQRYTHATTHTHK